MGLFSRRKEREQRQALAKEQQETERLHRAFGNVEAYNKHLADKEAWEEERRQFVAKWDAIKEKLPPRKFETSSSERSTGGSYARNGQWIPNRNYTHWTVLYRRDGAKCWICGKRVIKSDFTKVDGKFKAGPRYPTVDHVVPLAKGGTNDESNLRLAHWSCNTKKGRSRPKDDPPSR